MIEKLPVIKISKLTAHQARLPAKGTELIIALNKINELVEFSQRVEKALVYLAEEIDSTEILAEVPDNYVQDQVKRILSEKI